VVSGFLRITSQTGSRELVPEPYRTWLSICRETVDNISVPALGGGIRMISPSTTSFYLVANLRHL